jgi:hypothetical protein
VKTIISIKNKLLRTKEDLNKYIAIQHSIRVFCKRELPFQFVKSGYLLRVIGCCITDIVRKYHRHNKINYTMPICHHAIKDWLEMKRQTSYLKERTNEKSNGTVELT